MTPQPPMTPQHQAMEQAPMTPQQAPMTPMTPMQNIGQPQLNSTMVQQGMTPMQMQEDQQQHSTISYDQ